MWTDPTDGPIGFITHRASDNLLAVGSGADLFLVRYKMGNSKASWRMKLTVPHPPRQLVPDGQELVSTARAKLAHLLTRNAHIVVAYIDRGVVYACLSFAPLQLLMDFIQLLGHGKSGHGLGNIT